MSKPNTTYKDGVGIIFEQDIKVGDIVKVSDNKNAEFYIIRRDQISKKSRAYVGMDLNSGLILNLGSAVIYLRYATETDQKNLIEHYEAVIEEKNNQLTKYWLKSQSIQQVLNQK